MLQSLISVAALLLSAAIVLGGNGLLSVLLPVRGDAEGFATLAIGLLTAAYYLGLVLGCLLAARAIRRVGYIRAFAALAGTLTTLALVYPLVPSEPVWVLIRIPIGFCLAGVQMIIDAWVHERAANRVRGQVYAVYMIVNQVSVALGQLSMGLADPRHFTLFAVVAMAFSLSLVPVSLTTAPAPSPGGAIRPRPRLLYRISPVATVAALIAGLANGAFWGLGPLFARSVGLDVSSIAAFMSAAVVGGAVCQWPLGRVSDRLDRRKVMVACCAVGVGVSGLFALGIGVPGVAMFALSAALGASITPVYALAMAHVNDHIGSGDRVMASSTVLMLYGLGAMAGPVAASLIMGPLGHRGLFVYIAAAYLFLGLFAIYRMTRRSAAPTEGRKGFEAVGPTPASAPRLGSPASELE